MKEGKIAYTGVHILILASLNQTGREGVSVLGVLELEHTLDVLKKRIADSGIYIRNTLYLSLHPDFVNSCCDRQLL